MLMLLVGMILECVCALTFFVHPLGNDFGVSSFSHSSLLSLSSFFNCFFFFSSILFFLCVYEGNCGKDDACSSLHRVMSLVSNGDKIVMEKGIYRYFISSPLPSSQRSNYILTSQSSPSSSLIRLFLFFSGNGVHSVSFDPESIFNISIVSEHAIIFLGEKREKLSRTNSLSNFFFFPLQINEDGHRFLSIQSNHTPTNGGGEMRTLIRLEGLTFRGGNCRDDLNVLEGAGGAIFISANFFVSLKFVLSPSFSLQHTKKKSHRIPLLSFSFFRSGIVFSRIMNVLWEEVEEEEPFIFQMGWLRLKTVFLETTQ